MRPPAPPSHIWPGPATRVGAWRGVALLLAGVLSLGAAAQDGDDLDPERPTPALDAAQRERLQALLRQTPPTGATYAALDRFYEARYQAAAQLVVSAPELEQLLRDWTVAVPDNPSPRWMLARGLLAWGRRDEGYRQAEAVLAQTSLASRKIQYTAQLAMHRLEDAQYAQARSLLEDNDALIQRTASAPARTTPQQLLYLHALNHQHESRCAYEDQHFRLEAAIQACQRAVAGATELVQRTRGSEGRLAVQAPLRLQALLTRLSAVLSQANRPFDAERALHEAALVIQQHRLARTPVFHIRQARLRIVQQRPAEALALARKAMDQARAMGSPPTSHHHLVAHGLGQEALSMLGRWDEALEQYRLNDQRVAGNALAERRAAQLITRALVYAHTGRVGELVAPLQAQLTASTQTFGGGHFRTALRRGLLGVALLAQADTPSQQRGREALELAVPTLMSPQGLGEGVEEQGVFRLVRQLVFERYIELAGTLADAPSRALAFQVADVLRGSLVQQALSEAAARGAASTEGLADIVRREQDARNELQALYNFIARQSAELAPQRLESVVAAMTRRIQELETLRGELRLRLAREFPDYERLVNPQPPTPEAVAQVLSADEAFVSLLPTPRFVHVWLTRASGVSYHRASLGEAELGELVRRLRRTLDVAAAGPRAPAFDAPAAHTLYRELLAPLLGMAGMPRHLIVAPGGALGQIPFGVLVTGEPAGPGHATPWLIRSTAVSHVASASAWLSARGASSTRRASETFAGWGDPLFDLARTAPAIAASSTRSIALARLDPPADLELEPPRPPLRYATMPPLPETRTELQAIARVLQADPQRDLRLGEQATRQSVLAASRSGALARKQVVVFATHGLVAGDLPNLTQPALALAADGREATDPLAPLLTLQDVLTLKLNAEWVVLSACNTAANDGQAQEALSGLARGFFYAGSRSLLVTHWAVDSESATQLTTRTFAHHSAHPGTRRAESLRQATLQVMDLPPYAHPAFWAPYALVGDGAP